MIQRSPCILIDACVPIEALLARPEITKACTVRHKRFLADARFGEHLKS